MRTTKKSAGFGAFLGPAGRPDYIIPGHVPPPAVPTSRPPTPADVPNRARILPICRGSAPQLSALDGLLPTIVGAHGLPDFIPRLLRRLQTQGRGAYGAS